MRGVPAGVDASAHGPGALGPAARPPESETRPARGARGAQAADESATLYPRGSAHES